MDASWGLYPAHPHYTPPTHIPALASPRRGGVGLGYALTLATWAHFLLPNGPRQAAGGPRGTLEQCAPVLRSLLSLAMLGPLLTSPTTLNYNPLKTNLNIGYTIDPELRVVCRDIVATGLWGMATPLSPGHNPA